MSSLKRFFYECEMHGCFFHFGQIIWRRIQKFAFATVCGTNEKVAANMRMIRALAFVQPDRVSEYFRELISSVDAKTQIVASGSERTMFYPTAEQDCRHHTHCSVGPFTTGLWHVSQKRPTMLMRGTAGCKHWQQSRTSVLTAGLGTCVMSTFTPSTRSRSTQLATSGPTKK